MRRFGSHYAPALGLFFVVSVMLTIIDADQFFHKRPSIREKP